MFVNQVLVYLLRLHLLLVFCDAVFVTKHCQLHDSVEKFSILQTDNVVDTLVRFIFNFLFYVNIH